MMVLALLGALYGVPSRMDTLIRDGLSFAYRERYPEAFMIFGQIIQEYPEEPAGYVLKAALWSLYMLDFTTREGEPEFFHLVETGIRKARARLQTEQDSTQRAWYEFFQGAAFLYRAERKVRHRDYLDAVKDGWRGYRALSHAVALDSTLYDAYLGLGTVHYALSEVPRWIRILLPFLPPGDRERGLQEMRMAAERGRYVRVLAQDALAWTLAYGGRAREGLPLAESLVRAYPQSRAFRWTLSYIQRKLGHWKDWADNHQVIFYLTIRDQWGYPYDVALASYYLAVARFYLRDREGARWYLENAEAFLYQAERSVEGWKNLEKWIRDLYRRLGDKPRGPLASVDPAFLRMVDSLRKQGVPSGIP